MYSLSDICFLCLVHTKSLTSTLSEDNDGTVLEEKLKCFLIEYTHFKPEMTKNVCITCLGNINNLYSFRQQCLRNMTTLNDYFDKLTQAAPHFLENKPEIKNNVDDTFMETETKLEIKCEELDIDESGSPYDNNTEHKTLEVNIVVKDEPPDNSEDECVNNDVLEDIILPEDKHEDEDYINDTDSDNEDNEGGSTSHHKCDECDKTFTSKRYYKIHKRVHTGERPYECDECDKAFANTSNLARHKRIHDNVKPFRCSDCGKSFRLSCHLSRHKRIHTGEKPYECNLCQSKFTQPTHLKIHMRTHTGKIDKRFGIKSRLRLSARRKKRRNLENYNRCRKLGIPFTSAGSLKKESEELDNGYHKE